jgi:hypothetical protein
MKRLVVRVGLALATAALGTMALAAVSASAGTTPDFCSNHSCEI